MVCKAHQYMVCFEHLIWCARLDKFCTPYLVCVAHFGFYSVLLNQTKTKFSLMIELYNLNIIYSIIIFFFVQCTVNLHYTYYKWLVYCNEAQKA